MRMAKVVGVMARVSVGTVLWVLVLAGHPRHAHASIGKFWHVTDFHYDLNYTEKGDPENMCWGPSSGSGNVGVFGNYSCDAPLALVTSAINAMQKLEKNPNFILWTGDDTAHVDDEFFSTDKVVAIVKLLTTLLRTKFPSTPVFPVLGNHDYFPKNQVPVGGSTLQSAVAGLWKPWFDKLQEDVYSSFNASGWYWADVPDTNITVVTLNTLVWYKNNNNTNSLPDESPGAQDPGEQFSWADALLTDLAQRGRRVYLVGHIPSGTFERYQQERKGFHWYQPRYNERFIKLVQEHAQVIEAQFFGHHHTDSFRLFFKDEENQEDRTPVSYQLVAPGVTPWKSTLSPETGANNPGIRLVHYDTTTGRVVDVSTFYLNLTAANLAEQDEWRLEYNFSSTYNLASLSPKALYEVAKTLKDDKATFDRYYLTNTVSLEEPEKCSDKCRRLHWCAITEVDYDRFYDCNSVTKVVPFWAAFSVAAPLLVLLAN